MKIQLAIQGGGAKLISLLAAASAVQDLQGPQLELTRVVGTSAGAMVGMLLAAGVDLEGFRKNLKKGIGQKLYKSLSKPGPTDWLWTLTRGSGLRKTTVLADVIQQTLTEQSEKIQKPLGTLEDILDATGIEMRIVATDLRSPRPHVYKPQPKKSRLGPPTQIVPALLDSAGIPLYFKTWLDGPFVDGGLVQNFPWEELVDSQSAYHGKILGISFYTKLQESGKRSDDTDVAEGLEKEEKKEEKKDPLKTRGGYFLALLNTALDATTESARTRLGSDRVFSLNPAYDTFDFQRGLGDHALGDHFDLEKERALKWFRNRLGNSGITIETDPWSSASLPMMEKLGQMYEWQHQSSLLQYHSATLEISGHGLQLPNEPDVIHYSFSFSTLQDKIYCHTIALSQGSPNNGSFVKSAITLADPCGQIIETDYLPIYDPCTPEKREILLFFSAVLQPNTGPYTLRISDFVQGLTSDLMRKKEDVLLVRVPRTSHAIKKMEIVMHLPQEFHAAKMQNWADVSPKQVVGRVMTQSELVGFRPPFPGWVTRGWVGTDVQPSESFGPSISL